MAVDRPEIQIAEYERMLGRRAGGLVSRLELSTATLQHVSKRSPPLAPPRVAGRVRRQVAR